jgi:hypothetical protein
MQSNYLPIASCELSTSGGLLTLHALPFSPLAQASSPFSMQLSRTFHRRLTAQRRLLVFRPPRSLLLLLARARGPAQFAPRLAARRHRLLGRGLKEARAARTRLPLRCVAYFNGTVCLS